MKHSKDPFEAALEEDQEESPPESPVGGGGGEGGDGNEDGRIEIDQTREEDERDVDVHRQPKRSKKKNKDEDDEEEEEEEEENMEVELTKYPTSSDPAKMAKMQIILSQFTEDQMSRYESFRRSALRKKHMKRLLASVTGIPKPSDPILIVTSGIAKMFVGELVETARTVMSERGESGPIRPCHIRESYRRLKLEGKVPKRSVPRLFR